MINPFDRNMEEVIKINHVGSLPLMALPCIMAATGKF